MGFFVFGFQGFSVYLVFFFLGFKRILAYVRVWGLFLSLGFFFF